MGSDEEERWLDELRGALRTNVRSAVDRSGLPELQRLPAVLLDRLRAHEVDVRAAGERWFRR